MHSNECDSISFQEKEHFIFPSSSLLGQTNTNWKDFPLKYATKMLQHFYEWQSDAAAAAAKAQWKTHTAHRTQDIFKQGFYMNRQQIELCIQITLKDRDILRQLTQHQGTNNVHTQETDTDSGSTERGMVMYLRNSYCYKAGKGGITGKTSCSNFLSDFSFLFFFNILAINLGQCC